MLYINANTSALFNFPARYLKTDKTNNSTNSTAGVNAALIDDEKTSLTDDELALAKAHY